MHCCAVLALFGVLGSALALESADSLLKIGVLAYRGKEQAMKEWQGHADYLAEKLAPRRFQIVPLTLEEFPPAIEKHSIDLFTTNTGHYVELEAGGRSTRFATMRVAGPKGPIDKFGGAAFVRGNSVGMNSYADLVGLTIAIPNYGGFGGWQVHQREALAQGIDLGRQAARIIESKTQDKVMDDVLSGRADVGFVRSDMIESLVAAGKLDLAQVKVINPQKTADYPYLHSTRLYPHWPFARLDHVSEELTRDLLIALLQMPPDHPAAKAANIYGWTLGQNYQPVHDMFLELRLPPYNNLPVSFNDVMGRYGQLIVFTAGSVITLLLLALWFIARGNLALKRSQAQLRLAAGVFEHAQEGILITDTRGVVLDVNDTFLALTGYARDEVVGKNPRFLSSGRQDANFYKAMWAALTSSGNWRGELWNRRKDGSLYVQRTSISAVRDTHGAISHYIGLSYDVTALRESQEQLEQMAYFDALTGLPNRRLLADRLKQAIAQSMRTDKLLAICYLDLDGFKPINDNWGHAAGDRLLVEASSRLTNSVRTGDTVSRLGGDEFVVLLENLSHIDECEYAIERIRKALHQPFQLTEGDAQVSASIGVTLFPIDSSDPDTLIRHADQAMYAAKQGGRNRYQLFDAGGDRLSGARREAMGSIQQAIDRNEFLLYFQPKVNMRSGEILGAEALVRWQHPERGFLHPAEFLPAVDFVGMQTALGDWVLRAAIRQIAAWADAGHTLSVSINVAAEQLQHSDFIDKLQAALAAFPTAKPDQIELELLETAALHDLTEVAGVIERCQALGIHFAIDDFGTGYSSLTYLKQLNARTLKVDQSFVRDMLEDPDDLAIVDGIVGLAAAFRRQVVAEGVETIEHGRLLLQLGCELAQGYGIARPMAPEKLIAWLPQWHQPEEWIDIAPWPREDLPLLTMEVEHRRWITNFTAIMQRTPGEKSDGDEEIKMPPLDPHQCRFGRWLDATGRRRYGHLPALQELDVHHQAVHHKGHELAAVWETDPDAARARLHELASCRDTLLISLAQLRVMALGHH
jgi:diguanylate cyclase (GGDEF)-like protein/PAS domain S-box-containing protein